MTNEHDFDVTLVEEQTFDLTTGTESDLSDTRSFSSTIDTRNLFDIIIDGASTSLSWLVKMTQGITIVASFISIQNLSPTIKLKRIAIDALASITAKLTSEIKLKRIAISASFQQTINNPVTIALKRIIITPIITILRNTIINISIPKITIVANTILGFFRRLWFYDETALWVMDGETLDDLNYFES